MAATLLDVELSEYWVKLTPEQKASLLDFIKSFLQSSQKTDVHQYNQELAEAEAEYKSGNYISSEEMLQLIKKW